jgi:hypothetical protein
MTVRCRCRGKTPRPLKGDFQYIMESTMSASVLTIAVCRNKTQFSISADNQRFILRELRDCCGFLRETAASRDILNHILCLAGCLFLLHTIVAHLAIDNQLFKLNLAVIFCSKVAHFLLTFAGLLLTI